MKKYSVFTDIEAIGFSKSKFENLTERIKQFSPFFLTFFLPVPVNTENKKKKKINSLSVLIKEKN